jgi:hypothetical protein
MRRTICWALLFGALGCRSGADMPTSTRYDSAGVQIVAYSHLPERADLELRLAQTPLVSIGLLEGDEEYLFRRVSHAVTLSDGSILVSDGSAAEFRTFDSSGRFLRSFGGEGEGPGEFQELTKWAVTPGDTVLAWDGALGRLSTFLPDGSTHETKAIPLPRRDLPSLVWEVLPDGQFLVLPYTFRVGNFREEIAEDTVTITYWSPTAPTQLDTIVNVPDRNTYVDGTSAMWRVPLSVPPVFHATPTAVHLVEGGSFAFRTYTREGALQSSVRVLEERVRVTDQIIGEYKESQLRSARSDRIRAARRERMEELPLPDFLPALDRLMVGTDGTVWVRRYVPEPGDFLVWHSFKPDGEFLGTLEIPAALTPLRFESGRVLGRWRGEYDVQSLRIYGFQSTQEGG